MRFTLPSIQHIISESSNSFRRFPFAILAAVIATLSAIYLTELDYNEESNLAVKLLMISALGISLFTVVELTSEKKAFRNRMRWAAKLAGALLLLIYFFWLPTDIYDTSQKPIIRYILFFLGVHLLVAWLPFSGSGEANGFWQYNKSLFLRFLTAVLYSGVLFIGLSIALLSIDQLFGVEIREEVYLKLWIVLAFMFNTWFFLSGIPENIDSLDKREDYPKGLKIFTQYVLMPLVTIYLIILYGYTLKILIEWEWPEGWVANLVLGFSIVGIFALLLLYPIRNRVEYGWIKSVSRNYYIALIPMVILLLLAIWVRISEYSFTENRYFVLIAGLWLGAMALFYIFGDAKNIKIIPASLSALVFLSSFGPWGAFYVSETSQLNRVEDLLAKHQILSEGELRPVSGEVSFEDAREISAIFRYLLEVHGTGSVRHWFDTDSEAWKRITDESAALRAQRMVEELGLEYIDRWENDRSATRSFTATEREPISAEGYDWLVADLNLNASRNSDTLLVGEVTVTVRLEPDSATIGLFRERDSSEPVLSVDLEPMIIRLNAEYGRSNSYNIPPQEMILTAVNGESRIKLVFRYVQAQRSSGEWRIQNMRTNLLLTLKDDF
ncbi:MAG: DUF4153 domain-containing protein [Balneolaceae bacterium]|nr:DUF4153 domain-containing protein [Balneolaceae bacterium]